MKGTFTMLAVLGVALTVLPIPNVDEIEWFPPYVARDIAKFSETVNSEDAQRPQRDSYLRFRATGGVVQKIVNDQLHR